MRNAVGNGAYRTLEVSFRSECALVCYQEKNCSRFDHDTARNICHIYTTAENMSYESCIADKHFDHYRIGSSCKPFNFDECLSSPCINGSCIDNIDEYVCRCKSGFSGFQCETEINECESHPCLNGGNCSDEVNSYTCDCEPGFTGRNCETNSNECLSNPCINGVCFDLVNEFLCTCASGFTGFHCQTELNECLSNPCVYGDCSDNMGNYTCSCMAGYTDIHCESEINECSSTPCLNNGVCNDVVNGYTCTCKSTFLGTRCQISCPNPSSLPCARLFAMKDCQGQAVTAQQGTVSFPSNGFNDKTNSIVVRPGCTLTVYQASYFRERYWVLNSQYYLDGREYGWANLISSWRCTC